MLRKLLSIPFFTNLNEMRYEAIPMLYSESDLTPEYYETVKDNQEVEHQIGRLQNFRQIIKEIAEKKLPGDFIEFGTYKGFSLQWIAYFAQKAAIFDKLFFGIDGFVGLPNDDGVFKQGDFKTARRKNVEHVLHNSPYLYPPLPRNFRIFESLFGKKEKMNAILQGRKFSFIHIDCDIGSAAIELFQRFRDTDCLADECYILFDDYGCESSLAGVVDHELPTFGHITIHSQTNLTKNFIVRK